MSIIGYKIVILNSILLILFVHLLLYWYNLFIKKYNFSVRIRNQRYNIIFEEEDQDNKVNPYFILNENNSLLLSQNS